MGAATKVHYQGATFDRATFDAIKWAQRLAGFTFTIGQGSFANGSLSAGTHTGAGTVDVGCAGLSHTKIKKILRALKLAGFAAWFRNWPGNQHIHAVLFGVRGVAAGARDQLVDYDNGRDGLAWHRPDRSFRPRSKRRWSFRLRRPVKRR